MDTSEWIALGIVAGALFLLLRRWLTGKKTSGCCSQGCPANETKAKPCGHDSK